MCVCFLIFFPRPDLFTFISLLSFRYFWFFRLCCSTFHSHRVFFLIGTFFSRSFFFSLLVLLRTSRSCTPWLEIFRILSAGQTPIAIVTLSGVKRERRESDEKKGRSRSKEKPWVRYFRFPFFASGVLQWIWDHLETEDKWSDIFFVFFPLFFSCCSLVLFSYFLFSSFFCRVCRIHGSLSCRRWLPPHQVRKMRDNKRKRKGEKKKPSHCSWLSFLSLSFL